MRTREEYLRAADEWLTLALANADKVEVSQAYFQGALVAVALAEAAHLPDPDGPWHASYHASYWKKPY